MEPNTNTHNNSQKSSKSRRKCNCKSGKNLPVEPENINELASIEINVPADVDVELLLHRFVPDLTRTKKKNLTDRIHYFLSRITTNNDNYKLTDDGYHPVCSVIMKNIVDNRHYNTILDLLSDPQDPIIESNNLFRPSNPRKQNGECKGYRLTQKYNTGNTKSVIFPDNLWDRVQKHSKKKEQPLLFDYTFLTQQFDDHNITISPDVYEYIRDVGIELLARAEENGYQTKMVYSLIGRWLYFVEKINPRDIWKKVSPKNHRLNSNITNLPGELRKFLLVDGRPVGMIDVSSSQPSILASIMNINFFNDTFSGYNLYTIYPTMYKVLVEEGYIKPNVSYSSGNTMNYTSTISGSSTSIIYNEEPPLPPPPYMWCHFSKNEIESIQDYQSASFENDFYMSLLESYTKATGEVMDEPENIRQKLKGSMMYVLFSDVYNHRNHDRYIQMFRAVYPGVEKWIKRAHKIIGNRQLAVLLQRCESYLMLNVVAREFHKKNPEAPIFSIHDALLTYPEYIPEIAGMTLERFKDIIGTGVGVKDKTSTRDPRLTLVEIDEAWKEIEPIKTEKKFDKVAGSVLKSNIDAGIRFLHSPVPLR